ncbi:hypothetical protein ANO14919_107040 [Xylariales sp. No.14919]|nr:hypothetical protein ANO14919_107040 [Xylariales sp. No.14919]
MLRSPDIELPRLMGPPRSRGSTIPSQRVGEFSRNASNPPSPTLASDSSQHPPNDSVLDVEPTEDRQYAYSDAGSRADTPTHGVKRDLTRFQVLMIAFNATLGVGLYWRSGQILELGGVVAVLVAFVSISILAWAVMQCISELLGRWPVPGALSVFVSNFVDYELGIAVGIMYWLTYSVSFSALIATSAGEIRFWIRNEAFDVIVTYIAIPLILIVLNCLPVKYYGRIEVVFGILKLSFLFTIIVAMIVLASLPSSQEATDYNWSDTNAWDTDASPDRAPAFLMAISTAIFAFVGVEIVAACALEAKPPNSNTYSGDMAQASVMGSRPGFLVVYFSLIVGVVYTVSGLLTTFSVPRDACGLPRLSWLDPDEWSPYCTGSEDVEYLVPSSVFVLAAKLHDSPGLASALNFFLVFTALSSALTNLYIASRALYGLATHLHRSDDKFLDILSFFGVTNHEGVPIRAVMLSAILFIWVPFLRLAGYNQTAGSDEDTSLGPAGIFSFIEILTEIGSVGVVIVWACECVAFLSYYYYLKKHDEYLKMADNNYVDRKDHTKYPYRSHLQPIVGGLAFVGCVFALTVLGSASLYHEFHVKAFLSQFLAVFVFGILWAFLKVYRRGRLAMYHMGVDSSEQSFGRTLGRLSSLVNE